MLACCSSTVILCKAICVAAVHASILPKYSYTLQNNLCFRSTCLHVVQVVILCKTICVAAVHASILPKYSYTLQNNLCFRSTCLHVVQVQLYSAKQSVLQQYMLASCPSTVTLCKTICVSGVHACMLFKYSYTLQSNLCCSSTC